MKSGHLWGEGRWGDLGLHKQTWGLWGNLSHGIRPRGRWRDMGHMKKPGEWSEKDLSRGSTWVAGLQGPWEPFKLLLLAIWHLSLGLSSCHTGYWQERDGLALLRNEKNISYAPGIPWFPINMLLESATFINCEDNSRHYRTQAAQRGWACWGSACSSLRFCIHTKHTYIHTNSSYSQNNSPCSQLFTNR